MGEWIAAITEAAECNLEKVEPECRLDYIKKSTWEKIWERDAEKNRGDLDNRTHKLTAAIKRQVKADKKEHLAEQF